MKSPPFLIATALAAGFLTAPAFAADTKQMDDLYKGFKDGYGELAGLPAESESVRQAKADLLERFRSFFGSALSGALIEDLQGAFNGAFDGLRGPDKVKDALKGEIAAIDKEIGRLNGLKGNLGGTKTSLDGKIKGLGGDKRKWDDEVNRLIKEIRSLGGQASLIGDLPAYAAYPDRPTAPDRSPIQHFAKGAQLAHSLCVAGNCVSHSHGASGQSPGKKLANQLKGRMGKIADEIDRTGFDQLQWMSDPGWGQRGVNNLRTPDGFKGFTVKLPPPPPIPDLPTPDPNAGRIADLKAKLKVARQNAADVDGRIGELSAEIGVIDVHVSRINQDVGRLTSRKSDINAAAAAVKSKPKYTQLNGKMLFELKSITWPAATAKGVFEGGKAKVTANVSIFGTDASVSTDWTFTRNAASLATMVSAIKKTAPYKTDIGG